MKWRPGRGRLGLQGKNNSRARTTKAHQEATPRGSGHPAEPIYCFVADNMTTFKNHETE